MNNMQILEAAGSIISLIGIWAATQRSLWCWPISLLACALYVIIALDAQLYSYAGLQFIFIGFIFYGWYHWLRGKDESGEVIVQPLPQQQAAIALIIGALFSVVLGWFMHHYTEADVPYLDAALTSFSIVAQYWTARRHAANWIVWIVVDILYVGLFLYKEMWATAGLFTALVVLAIIGYRAWTRPKAQTGIETVNAA